jgi:t-SNARE complex subunit (syntaxin)
MTEENTHQMPPHTTDTYKQVIAARPSTIERDNGDCTLQVDGRDCTLEVDRRVEDSNKQVVNHDQAQVVESGSPDLSTPVQNKRKSKRKWYICGVSILLVVILIVIIVPAVATAA